MLECCDSNKDAVAERDVDGAQVRGASSHQEAWQAEKALSANSEHATVHRIRLGAPVKTERVYTSRFRT
jgi:hypothetical protein